MVPRSLIFGLLGVLVFGIAAAVAALSVQRYTPHAQSRIGGPFTLEDTAGHTVTQADLMGRPSAIFFGYTSCPDVCPTTLSGLTTALGTMGARADRLAVVFVSVDPETDTPAQLRDYLSSFDPRIRGFTGTVAQTDAAARAYHVTHRRVPSPDGRSYTVDHTSTVYLMDATGRLAGEINYGEDDARIAAKLTALVEAEDLPRSATRSTDLWADAARLARQLCGF